MAGRRPRFKGPKTYDPRLAQQTAQRTHQPTREELMRQQLGFGDDVSDSGSESGSEGAGITAEEIEELRKQLAEAQEAAADAQRKAAADNKAIQWRMRTSVLASKKAVEAKNALITEMIDTLYDLEQQLTEKGVTLEKVWSDHYEERNQDSGAGGSASPSARAKPRDAPESKGDGGGGDDSAKVAALSRQVSDLKAELQAAQDEAREARQAIASAGSGGSATASPGGALPQQQQEALTNALNEAKSAKSQVKKLTKRINKLEQAMEAAEADLEASQAATAKAQRRCKALAAQVEQLTASQGSGDKAGAVAAARVAALESEKEDLEGRVQQLEDAVNAEREVAAQAKAALASQSAAAQGAAAADGAATAQLKAELDAAQVQLATANKQAESAGKVARKLQSQVDELAAANEKLESQKKALADTMASAAGEKEAVLTKQLADAEAELKAAQAATREAEDANNANIEAAQAALGTWKEKYTAVKADRKQYKHQLQAAAAELQRLEEEVASTTSKLDAATKRADKAEAALSAAKGDLEATAQAQANAAGDADALRKEVEAAQARVEELQAKVDAAEQRVQASEKEVKTLGEELQVSQQQTKDANKTAAQREAQLQQLEKDFEDERQQIINILKEKYTKRVNKWKARASASASLTQHHRAFRDGMRQTLSALREDVAGGFGDLASLMKHRCRSLSKMAKRQNAGMDELRAKYRKESKLRKKLHNDIMELRGNIRVFARVRPVVQREDSADATVVTTYPEEDSIAMVNSKRLRKEWQFDHVFKPDNSNEDVFEQCKDLLTSVVDGYNVCIFAYGQTGAGKTHTMEGSDSNPGLNFRTLNLLFELSRERAEEWDFEISISLLEIYNETIADLLATESLTSKLVVKRGERGNYVPGLTVRSVSSCEEVMRIMRQGYTTRTTFATNANEHSSRSHCMLSVHVNARNKITNLVARGKLHLVDLAGSERVGKSGATGQRLKEAQAINKSLSALGNVIQARAAKNSHVPFRDSVLTYLLEDSLSNQSKTLMFVNLSPVSTNADESFCSLNFAARVRTVELGKASRNVGAGAGGGRANGRSSRGSHRRTDSRGSRK